MESRRIGDASKFARRASRLVFDRESSPEPYATEKSAVGRIEWLRRDVSNAVTSPPMAALIPSIPEDRAPWAHRRM